MTSGLVQLGYSLPEAQAVKLNFFVPWVWKLNIYPLQL